MTAVTIRLAAPADAAAVARIAALDSAAAPHGDLLVAEVDGEIRAVLPLAGGRALADPFHPSLALVAMLRAYTGMLRRSRRLPRVRARGPVRRMRRWSRGRRA